MALAVIPLSMDEDEPIPNRVLRFIRDAQGRIDEFVETNRNDPVAAFVPSDFELTYRALASIRRAGLAGDVFCEWGSGLGVVAGIASQLGFDACGIEIDHRLVEASRELLSDYDIPVEIVQGSLVPRGFHADANATASEFVTVLSGPPAYDELGLDPDDFDVVFAYPWPGEEGVITRVFERAAARGALLLTYEGNEGIRVRRKSLGARRIRG